MQSLKVLAICGSLRRDSYNRKALVIAKRMARELGGEVTELDLGTLDLPIYNQDIQDAGLPENVQKLKAAVQACDVLLIASPEYNYSISGVLKNAIDWGSRVGNSWSGKTAIIFGASNGPYGTVRGQFQLRQVLVSVNVLCLPQPMVLVKNAKEGFTESGGFADQKTTERLRLLIQKTFMVTKAFQAASKSTLPA